MLLASVFESLGRRGGDVAQLERGTATSRGHEAQHRVHSNGVCVERGYTRENAFNISLLQCGHKVIYFRHCITQNILYFLDYSH